MPRPLYGARTPSVMMYRRAFPPATMNRHLFTLCNASKSIVDDVLHAQGAEDAWRTSDGAMKDSTEGASPMHGTRMHSL